MGGGTFLRCLGLVMKDKQELTREGEDSLEGGKDALQFFTETD